MLWECFPPGVNERATVQVPTGLHSQTVVTGWSNYWVADTPAWRGFISSRKRDSQITVYPHRAPSSGLIPQLRTEKPHTGTLTLYIHMYAHTPKDASRYGCQAQLEYFFFLPHIYAVHVLLCHHMPRSSPCFLSNTPTCTIKECGMTTLCRCVCVWERELNRENLRDRWHQSAI